MKAAEVRRTFIDFFKSKGHTFVKSAPIFPKDDPSLLFTNAGMNQFKNIFLGNSNEQNLRRAVNSQKCMRVSGKHNDLEEVGKDGAHHTFFEMLGNWSFGDYYKEEAITWAWELLTAVYKLPRERLYVTVFREDGEAETLWKKVTGILPHHLFRRDEKDNFWEMGVTGPCGPCSEIHMDISTDEPVDSRLTPDAQGLVEIWNLVFIQYNRREDGKLDPLNARHVDTGMGLERLTSALQGKKSTYDTDIFQPLIHKIQALCGKKYGDDGVAFRVIADHVRAITFAVADGVAPGNLGRGYVIRRLLRRACRFGRRLGLKEPFLHRLVEVVAGEMGHAFPEVLERREYVEKMVAAEESAFEKTLDRGLAIFDTVAGAVKKAGAKTLPGTDAFKLYDTFGFPVDLTAQLAAEAGLAVDHAGFEREMEAQKTRARGATKFRDLSADKGEWTLLSEGPASRFVGYGTLTAEGTVRKLKKTAEGCDLVTDTTPFYAESGGQVGDQGLLTGDGVTFEVVDTQKSGGDIVHRCRIEGDIDPGTLRRVKLDVDRRRRLATRRNHTATHLLQSALRKVLGGHIKQAGSLNDPHRFRFDFTHLAGVSDDELLEVERLCNGMVLENLKVETEETTLKAAEAMGALAFFGDKYGDRVRVVKIGDRSIELCGGTHAEATGEIGYVHLVSESSVSSGVRRVEAVTGEGFGRWLSENAKTMAELARKFKAPFAQAPEKTVALLERNRDLERQFKKLTEQQTLANVKELVGNAKDVKGVKLIKEQLNGVDRETLSSKLDALAQGLGSGVVALLGVWEGQAVILSGVTPDLVKARGLNAGKIAGALAACVGGKGGGRPDRAQAGGKDIAKIPEAFARVESVVESFL